MAPSEAVYYNEVDNNAAEWLRALIARGLIPAGTVDGRSIADVRAADLAGFDQCHFFAGIGGWPYALSLAGWQGPVWTGSCPCQPLSVAGQGRGDADERHLWPAFQHLIAECRPPVVFGEQVAGKAGREWLAGIRADLEGAGYACGAADLCAAGVGAPHIRQRLFWVADAEDLGGGQGRRRDAESGDASKWASGGGGIAGGVADASPIGRQRRPDACGPIGKSQAERSEGVSDAWRGSVNGGMGDTHQGCGEHAGEHPGQRSAWASGVPLPCLDGKARRVEPAYEQMADGVSHCLGQLRPDQQEIVLDASNGSGLGREILFALQQGHDAAAVWQSLGKCIGFPKATILFAALRQQPGELGNILDGSPSGITSERETGMRELRSSGSPSCPSLGWQPPQQCAGKFANALHSLPFDWASLAAFTGSPLAGGVPSRAVRLRGYGNAVVPQVAAAFVSAFMEVRDGIE